ncbi:MAG: hypothetical protein QM690_11305 [Sphingobium sp.]
MEIERLGKLLAGRVSSAPDRDRMLTIQLFGTEYATEIGSGANQVIQAAGLQKSLAIELRQGIKIAPYVTLNK